VKAYDVWVPFGFCVALSVICAVTHSATAGSSAWVPAFLAFLPMAFLYTGFAQSATRKRVAALEAQLRERAA
jgi:hypothetical protein